MNKKTNLTESAAAGSVSAHSIAVRPDVGGDSIHRRTDSFLDFLSSKGKKEKKYANSLDMKPVKPFKMTINESVSLDQMFSKLSGIENSARRDDDNATTYGVEDDSGNMMKITVRGDQAQDFEVALAQELAEVEHYKMTGSGGQGRDVSMAEVLFNLKQKFDIVDVEFPEIPKDKIYNADKISEPEDGPTDKDFSPDLDDDLDDDMGDDTSGFDNDDDLDLEGEDSDFDDDLDSEDDPLDDEDSDVGEEFTAGENDEESMLKQIIKMLSAEAEARKAHYEAEAEKSRELQAEYAAKSAEKEMYKQEELLQMEDEKKRQQAKEKEAKQLADLARYRTRGVAETFSFKDALIMLNELGELEDETTIRMQRRNLKDIDDPREKQLHTQMLNLKRRLARSKTQQKTREDREEKMQNDQQNRDDQQQNQNYNPMQPVPDRRPIGGSNV